MQHARTNARLIRLLRSSLVAAAAIVAMAGAARSGADESPAYVVEISDVTAKVGEHAVLHASLRIRDGYRILHSYNNRVIALSSFDEGVAFDRGMVQATIREGELVFDVGLRATKPGKHPINGIFRVGYIHGTDEMAMVSLRLIASVTGTD